MEKQNKDLKQYYVYEYIRLDYNEPFYIGKGKGDRWKELERDRNKYFKNIVNKVPVAVVILHDNLTEQEAFEYECWYIWYLRDVEGYNLVNMTDGGEGVAGLKWTKEQRERQRIKFKGKNNPNYGKRGVGVTHYGRKHTEEWKRRMRLRLKNNHPRGMLNKRHTKETKRRIGENIKGDKNPFFGKTHTEEFKNVKAKE